VISVKQKEGKSQGKEENDELHRSEMG